MDVTGIAALATDLAAARTRESVGTAVLKRAMDAQKASAAALLAALPQPPSPANPPHLGNRVDTYA